MNLPVLSVTDFLGLVNQTMELAYPVVTIEGELADFRISKNRWLYFKLKDATASINCFGTVYMLPGPLEEGMLIKIVGAPRHHLQYGFSFNVQSIAVSGEGSLRKAQDLLQKKLTAEGLFDPARKRPLPAIPAKIGIITSKGSAAEADFIKITNERWGGLEMVRRDSLVQGMDAAVSLVSAVQEFNQQPSPPDVLVVIRGGGSQDDLAAFSDERVVRAVAASRIPTLVAIGHEVDLSLAELAADQRASTPTNAAQMVVPDRAYVMAEAWGRVERLGSELTRQIDQQRLTLDLTTSSLAEQILSIISVWQADLERAKQLLTSYDPRFILRRGYALIRRQAQLLKNAREANIGDELSIQMHDGQLKTHVTDVSLN